MPSSSWYYFKTNAQDLIQVDLEGGGLDCSKLYSKLLLDHLDSVIVNGGRVTHHCVVVGLALSQVFCEIYLGSTFLRRNPITNLSPGVAHFRIHWLYDSL